MSNLVSAPPSVRSGRRRAEAKNRTRQKVMAAARRMFSSVGYERTTIRDIAAECGVSTGSVFASFLGKSDLFAALVLEDRMAAYEVVGETLRERLEDPDAKTEDVLLAMFESGYRSRAENFPFVQVAISAAWSTELGADIRRLLAHWPISDHISRALETAVDRGEISRDADIPLLSQMLWDCALGMIPHAVFDGWHPDRLSERLRAQVRAILAGSRPQRTD
ncbi:MAG TPA: TetR/AcrR family transcriptional regulator [Caulobacteraceae bacterium]|nr:TetR/AcrR family transcriptional regulator [Caulobacteraceae bacterium]